MGLTSRDLLKKWSEAGFHPVRKTKSTSEQFKEMIESGQMAPSVVDTTVKQSQLRHHQGEQMTRQKSDRTIILFRVSKSCPNQQKSLHPADEQKVSVKVLVRVGQIHPLRKACTVSFVVSLILGIVTGLFLRNIFGQK